LSAPASTRWGLVSASIYTLYPDKRSLFLAALQQYMEAGLTRLQQREASLSPEATGQSYQQCFPPQALRICSPAADIWPLS